MDVQISELGNGGEMILSTNDIAVVNGVENMPYLAMFGGSDWWGNDLLLDATKDFQFTAETENILLTIPLNSSGRITVENAIKRDLAFLLNDVANTDLSIITRITNDNRLEISVKFTGGEFYMLWNPLSKKTIISPTLPKLTIWISPIRSGESLTYANTGFSLISGVTTRAFPAMAFYSNVDENAKLIVLNTLALSYGMTGTFVISGNEFDYNKGFSEDWEISIGTEILKYQMKIEIRPTPSSSPQNWNYVFSGINSYNTTDFGDGTVVTYHPLSAMSTTASNTYADGLTKKFVNVFHENTLINLMNINNVATVYRVNNVSGVIPIALIQFTVNLQALKPVTNMPISALSQLKVLGINFSGVHIFSPDLLSGNFPEMNSINVSNNNLASSGVDDIFNDFVANSPVALTHTGVITTVNQTPHAPPTTASLAARNALISAGWTIITD